MMRCFHLVTSLILLVAGTAAHGVERVRFVVQGPKGFVLLDFQQRSAEEDEAYMQGFRDGATTDRRAEQLAEEKRIYEESGSGYTVLPDDTEVNGYRIGRNQPSHLQICGGLALARVIGGPYKVPTEQAAHLVTTLGEKLPPAIGDVALWSKDGVPQHFGVVAKVEDGLLSSKVWVYSKNNTERAYYGPADAMPAEHNFGEVSYYHLDWKSIRATRIDGRGNLLSKGNSGGAVTIPAEQSEPTDTGVFLEAGKPYFIVGKGVCSLWDGQDDGCDSVYRYRSPMIPGGGEQVIWGQLKLIDPTVHLCTLIEQSAGAKPKYDAGHTYEAIVIGEGKTLKAMVFDGGGYSDNHGALSIEVYEAVVR